MLDIANTLRNLKSIFKRELVLLWFFAVLSSFALIVLQNKNKLPLGKGDFVFLALVAFLVALYRPRWIFFLFVAAIPLENIILASVYLPINLRPYQFLGGILAVAVAVLWIFKKLKFELLKPVWLDWLVFALIPFSFWAMLNSPAKSASLKNNLILLSFAVLYYLTRNFLRSRSDLIKTSLFFLGSNAVVLSYGFYQVLADKFGTRSFEVMFGRPNATFAEPDWLGIYLGFALAVFLTVRFYFLRSKDQFFIPEKYIFLILDMMVFLNLTLLITTLSRSAWVGAISVVAIYFLTIIPAHKPAIVGKYVFGWKRFLGEFFVMLLILTAAIGTIKIGKLSKFDIFDRARSTATSEQKITTACESNQNIPDVVADVNELEKFGCRHINLEEINFYKSQGDFVTEIFRSDPNVATRAQIYRKSWEILKRHPVLGVGFGMITQTLGVDERGAGLNESNIFLQIWAGSGLFGLVAFAVILGYLFIYSFRRVSPICPMNKIIGCPVVRDNFEKTLNVFTVLGILALLIPNLANAGLFMGILWLGLAVVVSIQQMHSH